MLETEKREDATFRDIEALEKLAKEVDKRAAEGKPLYVVNPGRRIIIFADLFYGSVPNVSQGFPLRLPPGKSLDLLRFFEPKQIKSSMSLATAYAQGLVRIADSPESYDFEEPEFLSNSFEAPPNIFDEKLVELIEKEEKEEEKLRRLSRDPLADRVRRSKK